MKDPILLETPAAARDYVYGLLRTDAFRRSDYVAGWIERFAAHPSVFARMSDEQLETPHFGTFFGMTYLRDYVEPAISDLYYLHEMVHAVSMTYDPDAVHRVVPQDERGRVRRVARDRGLRLPADAGLPRAVVRRRNLGRPLHRRPATPGRGVVRDHAAGPTAGDAAARPHGLLRAADRRLRAAEFQWASMWRLECERDGVRMPAYRHVEAHMAALRSGAIEPAAHLAWLGRFGAVPFPDQARLFAPLYWHNKLSYRLRQLG
ncbi:MAG: hypothetical protein IPK74_02670 [Deltaproteobacteria bacterium]|nr:hypothetical protein [Deltaproteobacteria bacterium]